MNKLYVPKSTNNAALVTFSVSRVDLTHFVVNSHAKKMQRVHKTGGSHIVLLVRKDNTVVPPAEVQAFCRFFAGEIPEHVHTYMEALFNFGMSGKTVEELLKMCAHIAWVEALLITCRVYTGVDRFVAKPLA